MEFEKGDLVLLGPNLPHCWKNFEFQEKGAESIVVQWSEDILGKEWQNGNEFVQIKRLFLDSSRGVKFSIDTAGHVVPILSKMNQQKPFERIISLLLILQTLAVQGTYDLLSRDDFSVKTDLKGGKNIDLIQNYVAKNYLNPISLNEVSKLVAMTEETFCRFFKRTFNKSFFTFLNEYKIKLACKLLIESKKQVSEIAYESGYESLPFFYRQFKKFIGCSPLSYRKKFIKAFLV